MQENFRAKEQSRRERKIFDVKKDTEMTSRELSDWRNLGEGGFASAGSSEDVKMPRVETRGASL